MRIAAILAAAAALAAAAVGAESAREALGPFSFSVLGVAGENTLSNYRKGFAEVYAPAIETGMFVSRRVEIGFSTNPWMAVRQPRASGRGRETVSATAADLFVRWFPLDRAVLHPYVELLDGPSYAEHRVPPTGSRFNFLTQGGLGFVYARGKRWAWQVGYRIVHFSNASLGEHNPSWNFNGLLLGGRWTPRP